MPSAWLSLGANIGDPEAQIEDAIKRLHAHDDMAVVKRSTLIRTAPWGKTDQNDFLNIALEVETALPPEALLAVCLETEKEMGRERIEVWGPRNIDIDVIAYERIEMTTTALTLPHPFAHERDFVLDPLREIAPEIAMWIVSRAGKLN